MRSTTPAVLVLCLLGLSCPAVAEPPAPDVKPPPADVAKARPRKTGTMDKLELEATTITGNSELPKVMYVVPWKRADIGDLGARPPGSLVDEVLAPVDREVFGRELSYFRELERGRDAGGETSITAGTPAP